MDTVEKQLAEAFAEAKENPSKDNVIVVPREEVKTESPTLEERSSDAGLSDSGEKHSADPEGETSRVKKRNEAATCSERRNADAFCERKRKNGANAIQGNAEHLPDGMEHRFDAGDSPIIISTHQEAEPVPAALQNEMPTEVPPVENGYPPEAPPRNWEKEWKELADAHPEVVGKELPEDIYKACLESEKTPLRVYESMMLAKQAEEIEALKQQIATLRQNAESASRAPVSAVTGGGAGAEPEDPFVAAFRRFN